MRSRLVTICAAMLALAAAPALAQERAARAPNIDNTRMDNHIKSYQDAVKYYQTGQLNLAEKELEKFLGNVGEHAGANFLLGMVRVQQQDFEKARTSFRTAVKLDPAMVAPHGWLGAIEAALGNKAGAIEQKTELEKMKAACAGTCPKAAEIDLEIQRVADNLAAAPG